MHYLRREFIESSSLIIKRYIFATRPMFLVASIFPVLVGTSIAYRQIVNVDLYAVFLALLAIVFVHAGVNVFNDVHDELNGTDAINEDRISPFTGGSRIIQDGLMSLTQMRQLAVMLIGISIVFGGALVIYKGTAVLWFGLAGLLLGITYSAPPLKLASRGLGESAVAVGFGLLPVVGAVWLQTFEFNWHAVLLSLPVALWVANILLINEVPDRAADQVAEKRTLAVRFSANGISHLYLALNILAFFFLVLAVAQNFISPYVLVISGVLLFPAIYSSSAIRCWQNNRKQLENAIKITLSIHAVNCLWLFAWNLAS